MRFLSSFCATIFLLLPWALTAQCGLSVNAGPDALFCPGGGSTQLNGNISGPGLSGFSWSPTAGLSDPNILNPVATVGGPMTYTLTAEVFDPSTNSIVNGDFSAGVSDFTTDYNPGSGGTFGLLSDEGEYVVTTNSNLTHTNFGNCPDHTGGGNMMVVNGSAIPNENVWCQTVAVTPNTTYAFNAWLQSVNPDNPASLQFSVNGTLLGNTFQASSSNCQWREFTESWSSGSAVSAEICIVNQNTQPSGNDFAIDDIFFGEVCTQTDEVNLEEVFLDADAIPTADLLCDGFGGVSTMLDGSNSSGGPNTFYQWTTTDGNIVSGATTTTPTVNEPGTYVLTARYDDGVAFCTDQVTVVVNPNSGNIPTADAVILGPISCFDDMGILGIGGSSVGNDFIYDWSTTDGNIVSGATETEVFVDQTGTYQLLVTNTISGCSETATVMITDNRQDPNIDIVGPAPLTCNDPTLELDGSGSDGGTDFSASWATTDGNIVAGGNTLSPTIDSAGTYQLTVTNDVTGCSATRSVMVTVNQPQLTAAIATPDTLDCNLTQLRLDGSGSPGSTFAWTTTNGNIVSDAATATPLIDAPGEYELLIRDAASGCESRAPITVRSAAIRPSVALQSPPPFTCGRAQIMLDATASTIGTDISYTWTAANGGGIVSDTNTLQPTVTGPGDYTLRIVNNDNGCSRDTTITIGENITPPDADAGAGFTLSCSSPADTLDGTASSQGGAFGYVWTTADGLLLSDTNSLRPVIGRAGTYQIRVLDSVNSCFSVAEVTVLEDNNAPAVTIALPDTLTCRNPTLTLNAAGSDSGADLTIRWNTSDGNFVMGTDGLSPTIDAPGTYQLTVTDETNGCPSTRNVTVAENVVAPATEAGDPLILTCRDQEGRLLATNPGAGYSYAWTGSDTPPLTDANTLSPLVNSAGRYFLEITNDNNGCTAIDSVDVSADQDSPVLTIAPGLSVLTCTDTSLQLNPGSTSIPGFSHVWTTPNGSITSPDTLPEISINEPGAYTLLLTNERNGCESDNTILITQDTTLPTVEVLPAATLNCDVEEVTLNPGNSDQGDPFSVRWTTNDGMIRPGTDRNDAVAELGGTYRLTITNSVTGCVDSAEVVVLQDTVRPVAVIAAPIELTCFNRAQNLNGSASSQGPAIAYEWSTNNGNISGGNNQQTVVVNAAGRYLLTVRNTINACVSKDSVAVIANQPAPPADAGTGGLLTCLDSTIVLGGAAGAADGLSYAWTTISGGTPAAANVPQTTATEQGMYELRVTNDSTGCFALDTAIVRLDRATPNAVIPPVGQLDCEVLQQTLVIGIQQPNLTFLPSWSTADGNILDPAEGQEIRVNQGGTYRLLMVNPENGCRDSTELVVSQDTLRPLAAIARPLELTCRTPTQQLDGTASSQGAGFSYAWSTTDGNFTGITNQLNATVDAAGRYRLTVRNIGNACERTDIVDVVVNQTPPPADAGTESLLTCLDTVAILGGPAGAMDGLSYTWTSLSGGTPAATDVPRTTANEQGTYQLRVTNDSTGCFALDTVVVGANLVAPNASVPSVSPLNCTVRQRTLTAAPPAPGLTYLPTWRTTDGNIVGPTNGSSITLDQRGTYHLLLVNPENGCIDSTRVTVDENVESPQAFIGFPLNLTCRNMSVQLDGRFSSSGPNFRYRWSTEDGNISSGGNTLAPTVTAAGNYVLTVTNEDNNCTAEDNTDVQQFDQPPALSAGIPSTLTCLLTSLELPARRSGQGQNFSYEWTTVDGSIVSGSDRLRPIVDQPGTYELTVINTDTECRATLPVTVVQDITPPTVELGEDFDLGCEDVPVNLAAVASGPTPFFYSWSTDNGTLLGGTGAGSPLIQGPGTYRVTVTSQRNGCTTSADVTTTQALLLGFDFEQRDPTCRLPLGRVELANIEGGTPPFLYALGNQPFVATPFADSLSPGRYPLVVQDANGCEVSSETTIPPVPELDLFVDPRAVITLGESYFINTRTNFADSSLTGISWTPVDPLDCADCLRPIATPTTSTTFTVSILSSGGCVATDSVEIIVDVLRDVYFPTAFSPTGDGINDVFLPFGNTDRIIMIQDFTVFDRWGESVFNNTDFLPNDPANGWDGRLNGQPMNPAVFVYSATVLFVDGKVEVFKGDVVLIR
ncbi:T9SS type B sorting domain-containing protein [Neolewinella persica]|uniref:T9SS type B sorting domain-containing protein n=1 Tax=Neolewinella persica TaxID=70998 RepID=UPI000369C16B|nr:gliding motility-associated C-terminal domain-containing protein [Neolewinella persica]